MIKVLGERDIIFYKKLLWRFHNVLGALEEVQMYLDEGNFEYTFDIYEFNKELLNFVVYDFLLHYRDFKEKPTYVEYGEYLLTYSLVRKKGYLSFHVFSSKGPPTLISIRIRNLDQNRLNLKKNMKVVEFLFGRILTLLEKGGKL